MPLHLKMRNFRPAKSKTMLLNMLCSLGADFVINYKKSPEFSKLVQEYTGGKGVNIILDPVGAQNYQ